MLLEPAVVDVVIPQIQHTIDLCDYLLPLLALITSLTSTLVEVSDCVSVE